MLNGKERAVVTMVETKCIYCGSGVIDATPNCDNIAKWYALHYPDLPVNSSVPDICNWCGFDYEIGDLVHLRSSDSNAQYSVVGYASLPSAGREYLSRLIVVQDAKGNVRTFRKMRIQPVPHRRVTVESEDRAFSDNGLKKDGYF